MGGLQAIAIAVANRTTSSQQKASSQLMRPSKIDRPAWIHLRPE